MRYILILLIIFSPLFGADHYTDHILICLDKNITHIEPFEANGTIQTGLPELDALLKTYQVTRMERWLTSASETDIDGEIRLANIFAVYFSAPGKTVEQALVDFQDCPVVVAAEPEYICRPDIMPGPYIPNDPMLGGQWYITRIMADWAWGIFTAFGFTPGDTTIVLADIDSGVEWTHPDLMANIWVNPGEDIDGDGVVGDFGAPNQGGDEDGIDNDGNGKIDDLIGWDFVGFDHNNPVEDNDPMAVASGGDHGTNTSGCLSAVSDNGVGIASTGFRVKILVSKHGEDSGGSNNIFRGFDGILYAARSGADVINCSWGHYGGYSGFEQSVINTAYNTYGSIVVASAGNSNLNHNTDPHYPSDYNNVICVAGTDPDDSKASGSDYGNAVDICAPYSGILTTDYTSQGGYETPSGTSFSAPIVAASIGLLKSFFPNMSNQELENRLKASADNIDAQNPSYVGLLGAGRVNVYKAIGQLVFPSLVYNSQSMQILNDDGDGRLNPGEGAILRVAIKNESGWRDVDSLWAILRSNDDDLIVTDSLAYYGSVSNGSLVLNITDPFEIQVDSLAGSGSYELQLYLKAAINDTFYYETIVPVTIEVFLYQIGFPITNLGYIQSSPAIFSPAPGSDPKIFVGSNTGFFYGFDAQGNALPNFPLNLGGQMWGSPAVADFDNNGSLEVAIGSSTGHLYIMDPQGSILLDFDTGGQTIYATPTVADLDQNGDWEIIFATYSGNLYVLNHDGTAWPNFPVNMGSTERVTGGCALADLDGDNSPEIIVGTHANHVQVYSLTGNPLTGFPVTTDSRIQGCPVVADLDGNGPQQQAIIVAAISGNVYAFQNDGTLLWQVSTGAITRGSPSLADVDLDGSLETVVGNNNGDLFIIRSDGSAYPGSPISIGEAIETQPVFADLNGDGFGELIVTTMAGNVYAYDFAAGNWYPGFPAQVGGQIKSTPQILDLDGDGDLEIAHGTNNSFVVLDVKTLGGSTNNFWNAYQGNLQRTGNWQDVATKIFGDFGVPEMFRLLQNYPNPFNASTVIEFRLPKKSPAELTIFNLLGQQVLTKFWPNLPAGEHQFLWDGTSSDGQQVASGIYFYRLRAGSFTDIKKMVLMR